MKRFLVGVVLGALAWYVLIEYDNHLTQEFIRREQMTVRPVPRYRPPAPPE